MLSRTKVGRMRFLVTIQTPTETRNATTQEIEQTWAAYKSAWASVEPLRGNEFLNARQVAATVTHRFRTRYMSGVTHKMRISWDARVFYIIAVINVDERDRELDILTFEEV